jgi:2-polyprenyl-3-methyl-5-hydroxy-6-metoxy-1,4-benzoquinol methylase
MNISLAPPDGSLRYSDTAEHFENGVLRLMNLSREEFDSWLALAASSEASNVLERLREGWGRLRPPPPAPLRGEGSPGSTSAVVGPGPRGLEGRLWQAAIAETPSHGVAICSKARHGWLVRWDGERFARETEPPLYEEEYFEGDKLRSGGYGDYTAQAGWRLQKAARQVRELRERTGLHAGRVLDIGAGYGFFRVALGEAGYEHDGLEVSHFARRVASERYGHATYPGTLEDHWEEWESRYDAVTLFDLIEHLANPERLLEQIASVLRPGGVLAIKTPNLDCPESRMFGPHYHSLKREHLSFFSPDSLTAAAVAAGFEPVHVATTSHLLVGFVGPAQTRAWEQQQRGADLVAWYRVARPAGKGQASDAGERPRP